MRKKEVVYLSTNASTNARPVVKEQRNLVAAAVNAVKKKGKAAASKSRAMNKSRMAPRTKNVELPHENAPKVSEHVLKMRSTSLWDQNGASSCSTSASKRSIICASSTNSEIIEVRRDSVQSRQEVRVVLPAMRKSRVAVHRSNGTTINDVVMTNDVVTNVASCAEHANILAQPEPKLPCDKTEAVVVSGDGTVQNVIPDSSTVSVTGIYLSKKNYVVQLPRSMPRPAPIVNVIPGMFKKAYPILERDPDITLLREYSDDIFDYLRDIEVNAYWQ